MNTKLHQLEDENLSETKTDEILRSHINQKFDMVLKVELEQTLDQEYHVSKERNVVSIYRNKRRRSLYFGLSVAASACFLVVAFNFLSSSSIQTLAGDPPPFEDVLAGDPPPFDDTNSKSAASSYLAMADIQHGGALKGNTQDLDARRDAILAFNEKNYAKTQQLYAQIEDKTEEDLFYSSVASMYVQNYSEAIANLSKVVQMQGRYQEEAQWYQAMAYILSGDDAKAKAIFLQMESSSWNYEESRVFLKTLNN